MTTEEITIVRYFISNTFVPSEIIYCVYTKDPIDKENNNGKEN